MTLGKPFNIFEPPSPHMRNGSNDNDNDNEDEDADGGGDVKMTKWG